MAIGARLAFGATALPSEFNKIWAFWFAPSDCSVATPAAVGIVICAPDSAPRMRSHCDDPKMNNLFLSSGPPILKPGVFSTDGGTLVKPARANSGEIALYRVGL